MAAYSLPLSRWFHNGSPAANCQVAVYQAGTTTSVPLFSDPALTSPLANPLGGNLNGEVQFFVSGSTALRLVVTTAGGQPVADTVAYPVPDLGGFTGTGVSLNALAGVTPGTAAATKALVTDANNSVAGLTRIAVTEGGLSPYGMDKNLVIGGDFGTNPWQRGTSFAAVADGQYTADRWRYAKAGTMAHAIARDADVPTVAQAGRYVQNSLLLTVTTAQASLGLTDFAALTQRVEGTVYQAAAQRPFTLSFWAKASVPGTYSVAFRNAGADRSYLAEYTVVTAAAWEFKALTVPGSPAAGTWNYTTGVGLEVAFALAAGPSLRAAAGAWQTGSYFAAPGQVNACATNGSTLRLALVQLEAGPADTKFDSRGPQQEIARCQRYLPAYAFTGTFQQFALGFGSGAAQAQAALPLPVTPRVPPTGLVVSAGTHFRVLKSSGGIPTTAVVFASASYQAATVQFNTGGGVGADACVGIDNGTTPAAFIQFTGCEL